METRASQLDTGGGAGDESARQNLPMRPAPDVTGVGPAVPEDEDRLQGLRKTRDAEVGSSWAAADPVATQHSALQSIRASMQVCLVDATKVLQTLSAGLHEQEQQLQALSPEPNKPAHLISVMPAAASTLVQALPNNESGPAPVLQTAASTCAVQANPSFISSFGQSRSSLARETMSSSFLGKDWLLMKDLQEDTKRTGSTPRTPDGSLGPGPHVLDHDVQALEAVQGWRSSLHAREKFALSASVRKSKLFPDLEEWKGTWLQRLDWASCALVLLNTCLMMLEVELELRHALEGNKSPSWLWYTNCCFAAVFSLELLVRMWLEGSYFATGLRWRWNIFDLLVVTSQVVDLALSQFSFSFMRSLRSFRMIRAARIVKTARYVRELRLMVTAVAASLPSLLWALILIFSVVTLYSMFLSQIVRGRVEHAGGRAGVDPDLLHYFGSLPQCVLTLFMAVTGGADWDKIIEPLRKISTLMLVTFVFFLAFLLLGMLNILTAIFVESTNKLSELDSDLVIMATLDQEESAVNKLKCLLESFDTTGTGSITEKDFEAQLQDPRFRAQIQMLDLHVHEARGLFRLLDIDHVGKVNIAEMLHGMMRLKGTAKALDMATMLYENKRMYRMINRLAKDTDREFKEIKSWLTAGRTSGDQATTVLADSTGSSREHSNDDRFLLQL